MEKILAWENHKKARVRRTLCATGCVLGVAAYSFSASASVLYPGPFVGSTVTYSNVIESSGQGDPSPLFGEPVVVSGNQLSFDPEQFAFSVDAPPADTTDGALSFVITSNSSDPIPGIVVSESGDYSLFGFPTGTEGVASILSVTVTDLSNPSNEIQAFSAFIEVFDDPPFEGVFWENEVVIDLSSFGTTEVEVVLNNTLQAVGDLGVPVTTFIRKKDFDVDIIPEPSSAILIAVGAGLMAARRRRG
ncbi:MAG: PEP-CTERM sorting domain-containing protein [Planctomycetota bacterium]